MQPSKGFATGSITTQNLNPNSGVPTPGSFVVLPLTTDYDTLALQVMGTWGVQPLSLQGTIDGVNWITFGGAQALVNLLTAIQGANIPAGTQGIFQADVASFQGVRLTQLASGMTGTAVVSLAGTSSNGMTGLDTPVQVANGTSYNLVTAATTNGALIAAGARALVELAISNPTATAAYVKLYNKATAPTVGTDVPVMTIAIPATAAGVGEKAFNFTDVGKQFPLGLGIAVTAAAVATDTGVTVAGIQINGTYK